ncbi:LytTR family DNA-binding domain-containing protein [Phenylobacterium sp.]|jgi:hypothetical protein|uniref:LytTR family DNA-binding domain-containing protein n=1 Tax=Phenylobacterium sp. TaxID=1871053 RepID=UPI002F9381C5
MVPGGARSILRRTAVDAALLVAFGLFMGVIGPYGTIEAPEWVRFLYWQICIVGGGVIGIILDETVGRRIRNVGWRIVFDSAAMTPLVFLLVAFVSSNLLHTTLQPRYFLELLFQVFVVCVPIMALRVLVWRAPAPAALPDREAEAPADAVFRQRLSAKRREARIYAVEAEDHYLRVHTDAGEELITCRFADALAELSRAKGFRTHRSWWAAADAIEDVRWTKGRGEARLAGGLVVPVSRSNAPALKQAGWF